MNNIDGKVWGVTEVLFRKNNVEVKRLKIEYSGYCSKHKHDHKYNMFFVEKGKVRIKVWKNDYDLCDETILEEGDSVTVMPGEFHRFEAMRDSVMFEFYWVQMTSDDIEREDCGGKGWVNTYETH